MIMKRLKEETRSSHEGTEKHLDLFSRMLTKQEYARLLGRFWGFYAPIESKINQVAGLADLPLNLSARQKKPLLQSDLASLDWNEPTIQALPLCVDLPALDSVPQALGCLYVLEGSTLGGQFISRHLQERLEITPDHGGRFFASYGPAVGSMWKAFGETVTAYSTSPQIEDAIVRSALETFASFGRWFEKMNEDETPPSRFPNEPQIPGLNPHAS
jgi:heme oxygenase (biliverdin-IX-beta and delta-forming)